MRLAERPIPRSVSRLSPDARTLTPVAQDQRPLGLTVKDLDAATVRRLSLPDELVGVLITDVDPAGPARLARIHPGHVLLEINRHRIASVSEFRTIVSSLRPGESAALLVYDRLADQRALYAIPLDPQ